MDEAARAIIDRLDLRPHPEGGFFREVYRSPVSLEHPSVPSGEERTRSAVTHIYYLLADQQFSAFHRVKWTDEIWHLYAGGPLELHVIDSHGRYSARTLTTELEHGEPSAIVPAGLWQGARLGDGARWAFCGCSVAPGFDFAEFEMARAQELLAAHPEHEAVIRALTRS